MNALPTCKKLSKNSRNCCRLNKKFKFELFSMADKCGYLPIIYEQESYSVLILKTLFCVAKAIISKLNATEAVVERLQTCIMTKQRFQNRNKLSKKDKYNYELV